MSRIIGVTVGTSISPEALKKKLNMDSTSGGNSIFYMDSEVKYPVGNGFYTYSISKNALSNSGTGIKVGDIIVASNGTLCKVTSVGTTVGYDPIGTISENSNDSGGHVAYDEAQELTDEQKTQARENIGVKNGYSTYYADLDLPHPMESENGVLVLMSKLSNEGAGIKVGDIVIDSNGTLCKVTEVYQDTSRVRCYSLTSIGGTGSGGNVDLGITGATVGQTVKISAVDENGVPTAWAPVIFSDSYTKPEIDAIMGSYVTDIDTLVGGDS